MSNKDNDDKLYNWASAPDNSMMPASSAYSPAYAPASPAYASMPDNSAMLASMPASASMPDNSTMLASMPASASTTVSPLINYNSISSESPLLDLNFQQESTNNYQALNDIFAINNNNNNNNNSNISNNEIEDMLNRLRIRTNELNNLNFNINQDNQELYQNNLRQIRNLIEDINLSLEKLTEIAGNERQSVEALSMLSSVTVLYLKYFQKKNEAKSVLSKYYANLCAIGTYLNPDVNRVIATIEAGISLALITNQALPFMRPFNAAPQIFTTLTVGALIADMTHRYNNAGCKLSELSGNVRDAVQPLIQNAVPLCNLVANSVCSTTNRFLKNTSSGRFVARRVKKMYKTLKQIRENAKNRREKIKQGVITGVKEFDRSADKFGRRTLRAVTDPVGTLSGAISYCRSAITGLSSMNCSVVNNERKPSSSSSLSTLSSRLSNISNRDESNDLFNVSVSSASSVRKEIESNNPIIMSPRELRDKIDEDLDYLDAYVAEEVDISSLSSSSSREIGNKNKRSEYSASRKKSRTQKSSSSNGGKKTRR